MVASAAITCGGGEWKCGGDDGGGEKCISLNKFCDGVEHCDDGSDEPLGCTSKSFKQLKFLTILDNLIL